MLEFLRGKVSDRKLRLFACACCRRVWHLLRDPRARDAVEVAERFADGLAEDQERSDARKAAQQVAQSRAVTPRPVAPKWERRAASAVYYATARDARDAGYNAWQLAAEALVWRAGGFGHRDSEKIDAKENTSQAFVLRDLFGPLPFRPSPPLPPAVLAWNDGTVGRIAQAIYDERAFDRLPILADALEDAGCDSEELIRHCRSAGPHVRGCWAVDLLLGKS
jgi:hypothetical protein